MAVRIYKLTDRVTVKIDELEFKLAPLSFDQKRDISSTTKIVNGKAVEDHIAGTQKAIKYSVKEVKGLETMDGSEYELSFDDNGNLDDVCVGELLNIPMNSKLMLVCNSLLAGIPDELTNPITGEKIAGVELVKGK